MKSAKEKDFGTKDIIAMVIAAYQLLLPTLLIIFAFFMIIYLLFTRINM